MNAKEFAQASFNVHGAKHGEDFIYIGHDPANRWSAFFKGKEQDLGVIDTLAQAQAAAHHLFDTRKKCSLRLEWKLIAETKIKDVTK
jgi:hypothetical protein